MSKGTWYLILSKTIWHRPNILMEVLERTKFQGHFGMGQMSYECFGQYQMSANRGSPIDFSQQKSTESIKITTLFQMLVLHLNFTPLEILYLFPYYQILYSVLL